MDYIEFRRKHRASSTESCQPTYIPVTPNSSEVASISEQYIPKKTKPTRTMIQEAVKDLSTQSRKGFSLAKILKYVLHNYLHSPDQVKHRLPFIKKFIKSALENGEIVKAKGVGLTGSFRVPPTSPLHKNVKINQRKIEKQKTKLVKRLKKHRKKRDKLLKPKKLKA